jgi:predicted ATPase
MASKTRRTAVGPPRIEAIRIENYRALRNVALADLTPLTVLLGPNGSGKSTVFDVFDFLSECFTLGLRKAWDKRGRFRELRTRGSNGHILFELVYRETPESQPATYHLEIDEQPSGPVVAEEWLRWRRVATRAERGKRSNVFCSRLATSVAGSPRSQSRVPWPRTWSQHATGRAASRS